MDYTPSRYIQKTLLPDEKCVKDARFPWVYTVHALFLWVVCALFGYAAGQAFAQHLGEYRWYPAAAGFVFGFWLFLMMMVTKWTTEIILTTTRLIYKRGFMMVRVVEVDIEQLASDRVEQSIWGRLFDYGSIHVRCIEADDIDLPEIAHPYEFRNALEQQKHIYREAYMRVERLRRRSGQEEDSNK